MTYDAFDKLLDDAAHAVLALVLAADKTAKLSTDRQFDALVAIGDAIQQPLRTIVNVSDDD